MAGAVHLDATSTIQVAADGMSIWLENQNQDGSLSLNSGIEQAHKIGALQILWVLAEHYRLTGDKTMINVGSVGQPRDSDPRSCYVIVDGDRIVFRRVEYPVEVVAKKIYAVPNLDNMLGDRLLAGR